MNKADQHRLLEAEGWLDLDDPVQAAEELEKIEPSQRGHPVALLLRCRIYLATHRPDYTHVIATTLTEQGPDLPHAWFYLACACSRLNRNDDAGAALKQCFVAAVAKGEEQEWQERALAERDLDGLWCEDQMEP